jgi:hypothetical protein
VCELNINPNKKNKPISPQKDKVGEKIITNIITIDDREPVIIGFSVSQFCGLVMAILKSAKSRIFLIFYVHQNQIFLALLVGHGQLKIVGRLKISQKRQQFRAFRQPNFPTKSVKGV